MGWLSRWFGSSFESDDPANPGLPPDGLPALNLYADPHLARFEAALRAITHRVPRMRRDTERSCPVPAELTRRYVNLEEGNPAPDALKFIRTGVILDSFWWLWSYQARAGEPAFVSVVKHRGPPLTGAWGASPSLTSDQVLLFDFARFLETTKQHLVRREGAWTIENVA